VQPCPQARGCVARACARGSVYNCHACYPPVAPTTATTASPPPPSSATCDHLPLSLPPPRTQLTPKIEFELEAGRRKLAEAVAANKQDVPRDEKLYMVLASSCAEARLGSYLYKVRRRSGVQLRVLVKTDRRLSSS
jgi:hypothetical protein